MKFFALLNNIVIVSCLDQSDSLDWLSSFLQLTVYALKLLTRGAKNDERENGR